jgi:hypothetical protein
VFWKTKLNKDHNLGISYILVICMAKDGLCWIIGVIFFLMAFTGASRIGADSTVLDSIEVRELATVIVEGLIGLAFVVSGSVFHLKESDSGR